MCVNNAKFHACLTFCSPTSKSVNASCVHLKSRSILSLLVFAIQQGNRIQVFAFSYRFDRVISTSPLMHREGAVAAALQTQTMAKISMSHKRLETASSRANHRSWRSLNPIDRNSVCKWAWSHLSLPRSMTILTENDLKSFHHKCWLTRKLSFRRKCDTSRESSSQFTELELY